MVSYWLKDKLPFKILGEYDSGVGTHGLSDVNPFGCRWTVKVLRDIPGKVKLPIDVIMTVGS